MNNVLVTGGAGFIGAHVCKELFKAGYNPVVVDNLSTGFRHNAKWGEIHVLDLRNLESLFNGFENYQFLGVIHLAASAYVGESQRFPLKYFDNNVVSTINVLLLMEFLRVKNIVFSSSCATYGIGDGRPFSEQNTQSPINNYGLSKKICEDIILKTNENSDRFSSILRYFNASGADPDGDVLEEHNPETHAIPLLIDSALNGHEFEVFGDNYETRDGSPIRDYVHVSDLARAHVLALEILIKSPRNYIFNLGSGTGISIFELIQALENLGLKPRVRIGQRRSGDPASLIADISFAENVLNWHPINSNIENILKTALIGRGIPV